jgi:hypothetical protein
VLLRAVYPRGAYIWKEKETKPVARIDDYKESFRLATQQLMTANLHHRVRHAGAEITVIENAGVDIRLPLLGEDFIVRVGAEVEVVAPVRDGEVSLPEKILICHYLLRASGDPPTGKLITFRQIPDGHFYFDAFQRRTRDPFLATFGTRPELFDRCAELLGGTRMATADVAWSFQVLPQVTLQLCLWKGDEEFPPEANVLMDESIIGYLPVEDIAVVSGMLVYRLMAMARQQR